MKLQQGHHSYFRKDFQMLLEEKALNSLLHHALGLIRQQQSKHDFKNTQKLTTNNYLLYPLQSVCCNPTELFPTEKANYLCKKRFNIILIQGLLVKSNFGIWFPIKTINLLCSPKEYELLLLPGLDLFS